MSRLNSDLNLADKTSVVTAGVFLCDLLPNSITENFRHIQVLTVSRHSHHQAFLEAALLASVAVDSHDGAAVVLKALLVLDVLLNAPPEEALWIQTDQQLQ